MTNLLTIRLGLRRLTRSYCPYNNRLSEDVVECTQPALAPFLTSQFGGFFTGADTFSKK
jgi:histone H3/H4